MIQRPVDQITKADLEGLVREQVAEDRTLEFKSQLPGGSDGEKKEFLADVTALANTLGGDILYGVEESEGVAGAVRGVAIANLDAERLRLEQIIGSGIQPRIAGMRIEVIAGFERGPVVILRVPPSWRGPHMVSFQGASRFYGRTSAGKFQMEHEQIKDAFLAAEVWPERFRRFRTERLTKVGAGQTPVSLPPGAPLTIIHLMPMSSRVVIEPAAAKARQARFESVWRSHDSRFNVDGLLNFHRAGGAGEPLSYGYCQVFCRGGMIECVDAGQLVGDVERKMIPSVDFEGDLGRVIQGYVTGLHELEVPLPYVLSISMLRVQGFEMAVGRRARHFNHTPIDRSDLILPEVLVEDAAANVLRVLRPVFDGIWNAAGYPFSFNYDDDGNWKPDSS